MEELYRKGVGIVVFNDERKVLLCERSDFAGEFQFPQGGLEAGETFIQAAKRELFEETSISSVELVATIEKPLRYIFPPNPKFKHIGQEMYWVLYHFTGKDEEINLNTKEKEFNSFKWEDIDLATQTIVEFKRNVYIKAVQQFKPFLADFKNG